MRKVIKLLDVAPKPPKCRGCALDHHSQGFSPGEGIAKLGVVLVGEALGDREAETGRPFQGPAGHLLNNALQRAGIDREDLLILNAISCQPPDNKLHGRAYYPKALFDCRFRHLGPALRRAKPKVIVALGGVALFSLLEQGDILKARGYPVWSSRWNAWVLPTIHPSYIMRGNWPYEAILIHDLQKAVEIARDGWQPRWGEYLLDPTPAEALAWAKAEVKWARENGGYVSNDIETPEKEKGVEEDKVDVGDKSYKIVRLSFTVRPYTGMSIPFRPEYMAAIRTLLENDLPKVYWNKPYDVPRLVWNGVDVGGIHYDGMIAWHVLNTDLKKDLGTVATFLCPDQPRWKHLNRERPAFYNAVDSDVALRAFLKALEELDRSGLREVYDRYIVRVGQVTAKMSRKGVPIDPSRRQVAAETLKAARTEVDTQLGFLLPRDIRAKKVLKRPFKKDGTPVRPDLEVVGEAEVEVKFCPNCGLESPTKPHFRVLKKKVNPCAGLEPEVRMVTRKQWAYFLPLKISPKLILAYLRKMKYPVPMRGKGEDRKPTTDENALKNLLLRFQDDPVLPLVLRERKVKRLQGSYVGYLKEGKVTGGLIVSADGRVHTYYNDNPSTLRTASENPNMQNLPRAADTLSALVKGMFVAGDGKLFVTRDFASIESLIVAYLAGSKSYYRVSKLDAHTFVTLWMLYELHKRIPFSDVPQLDWSDEDLKDYLARKKKEFKTERQGVKHMGHATNYMSGAKRTQEVLFDELGILVPLKEVKRFQQFYKSLFPEIPQWHWNLAMAVDGTKGEAEVLGLKTGAGWVRNPYGVLHRFYEVIQWKKVYGKWSPSFGEPAKALIAFGPQSIAACIAKDAMIRLDENHPELTNDGLCLFVHDDLMAEVLEGETERVLAVLKEEMEKPNLALPLDPAWGMGEYVTVATEGKVGKVWGEMEEVKD